MLTMNQKTTCTVKGVTLGDGPTELSPGSAVPLTSIKLFSVSELVVLILQLFMFWLTSSPSVTKLY